MRAAVALSLVLLAAVTSSACLEEQRYFVERERVHLLPSAAPVFVDLEDNAVFIASRRFTLPLRPPSDFVMRQLYERAAGLELPFPRLPWVESDHVEIKLDYVLENRSDSPVSATVFVDGINEFFAYAPTPTDFHQYERRILLEPGERFVGTVRELHMEEVAVDLATVVNGAPNSALVVHTDSQSTRDPRVQEFIPEVIPGLVAFRIGIQTENEQGVAPELLLRLSARAQDHQDRVAERGDPSWHLPTPQDFVPIVPEEP